LPRRDVTSGGGTVSDGNGEAHQVLGRCDEREATVRLDGLRTYVQLAEGLTEVAKESAVSSARALLTQGASRLGFVSAAELEAASLQARSLEERVQRLESQMREQETAAVPATPRKQPRGTAARKPATTRPRKATIAKKDV
jgi:hypothetical protein